MSLTQNLNVIPFSLTGLNNINASSINGNPIYTGNVLITFTSALLPTFTYDATTNTIILNLPYSSLVNSGILSNADWSTFNSKENALTFSSPLNRVVNTISIQQASSSLSGYLSNADWTTFNNKENVLTFSSPLNRTSNTITIQQATALLNGYLSSTDWTTFNNKVSSVSSGTNMNLTGTAKDPIINLNSSLNNITLNQASVINGVGGSNSLTISLPSWSFTGSTPCYLLCQVGANTCYYLSTSQLYTLYPPPSTPVSYNGIDVNNTSYNFSTTAQTALLNNGYIYSSSTLTSNLNLTFPSANMLASVFGSTYTIRFQIIPATGTYSYALNYNAGGTTYINVNNVNQVVPYNISANLSWDCVIQLRLVSGVQVSYIDLVSIGANAGSNLVLTALTNTLTIEGSTTSVDLSSIDAITRLIEKTEKVLHLYGQGYTTIDSDLYLSSAKAINYLGEVGIKRQGTAVIDTSGTTLSLRDTTINLVNGSTNLGSFTSSGTTLRSLGGNIAITPASGYNITLNTSTFSGVVINNDSNTSLQIGSSVQNWTAPPNIPTQINNIGNLTSSQTEQIQFKVGNSSNALNPYSTLTLPSMSNASTNPNFASAILGGVPNATSIWAPGLQINSSNNTTAGCLYKGSEIRYDYVGSGNTFSINNGATTGNNLIIANQVYATLSQISVQTADIQLLSTDGVSQAMLDITPSGFQFTGTGSTLSGNAYQELPKTIGSTASGGSAGVQGVSTTQTLVASGKNRCYVYRPTATTRINLPSASGGGLNIGDWFSITNVATATFALNIYNGSGGSQIGLCNAGTYGNANKFALMYSGTTLGWYQIA
jgi:hypothetical protein